MHKLLYICLFAYVFASCQEDFDKRLQREAQEFTETKCPMEPETGTRLDSTTYDPQSHIYTRWFSLSQQNEAAVLANAPLLRRSLVHQLIDDVDFKAVKENGVTFRYVYRSLQTGKIVYDTNIKAEEYNH